MLEIMSGYPHAKLDMNDWLLFWALLTAFVGCFLFAFWLLSMVADLGHRWWIYRRRRLWIPRRFPDE